MMYQDLENLLKKIAADIRQRLADADIADMQFEIEISGPTMTGDLDMKFAIGNHYSKDRTEAGTLNAAVDEHLRRRGWNDRHKPLCLPAAPQVPDAHDYTEPKSRLAKEDEIPI